MKRRSAPTARTVTAAGPAVSARVSLERRREVLRFLIVGASNTVVGFGLFALLTFVMSASYAYTCAYAVGVLYAGFMSMRVVFKVQVTARRYVRIAVANVLVYLVGLGVIRLLEWAGSPRVWLILGTAAVTVPLSYFGGRFALSVGRPSASSGDSGPSVAGDAPLPGGHD